MNNEVFKLVANELSEGCIILDENSNVCFWNQWIARASGVSTEEAVGRGLIEIFGEDRVSNSVIASSERALKHGVSRILSRALNRHSLPLESLQSEGGLMVQSLRVHSIIIGKSERYCAIEVRDDTLQSEREGLLKYQNRELSDSVGALESVNSAVNDALERSERERIEAQSHRMEAIGQLAAGIAHEINTPTQYVGDNTRFLQNSFDELSPLLKMAAELASSVCTGSDAKALGLKVKEAMEFMDFEFLTEEIPRAIEQSLAGVSQVRKIVSAMKEFSHPGQMEVCEVDINRSIQSAITVATNEWKYVADLETDFETDMPHVPCRVGELSQAILNLVVNAAHAIDEKPVQEGRSKGVITVTTRHLGAVVEIRVADTGMGIADEIRGKVFDPFFTTKEIGKGTGQGLAIAHDIITNKHAGTLSFEPNDGGGTTFIVRLPIDIGIIEKAA